MVEVDPFLAVLKTSLSERKSSSKTEQLPLSRWVQGYDLNELALLISTNKTINNLVTSQDLLSITIFCTPQPISKLLAGSMRCLECNKQMNARWQQKQQLIRTINFQQYVSGFTLANRISSNLSSPNLNLSKRPQTSYHKKIVTSSHPLSGRRRVDLNSQREHQIAVSYDKRLIDFPQDQLQDAEEEDEIKNQQRRHQQFVKSYHQWLKDTQLEEYQSSRLVTTFALKKTRASLRPKKEPQVFQFKTYQQHFNQQYHPPNLFPSRTHQSLKKLYPKTSEHSKNHKKPKSKNEGELKFQIMKSVAKKQTLKEQKVRKSHNIRLNQKSDKASSLFMKTFSNPKILAIQNGQLVTGTKILFIN